MKRLFQLFGGEALRPPVWLMRQAGRNLPKYRAVRAGVPEFVALRTNPELAAEVTMKPVRHVERKPLLRARRGRPFILNLGPGVVPQPPPEHVAALLEHVRGS